MKSRELQPLSEKDDVRQEPCGIVYAYARRVRLGLMGKHQCLGPQKQRCILQVGVSTFPT